jgi:hypothetical protein
MRQAPAQPAEVETEGMDLETWLRFRWARADTTAGRTLRSVAKALGILLPMRRTIAPPVPEPAMRRTKPVLAESPDAIPSSTLDGIALDTEAEGVAHDVDESPEPATDESLPDNRYDDESAWTHYASLFDALPLHPENRGWP